MPIEHYHAHHGMKPKFFKLREESGVPYLGVELEVDKSPDRNSEEVADKLTEIMGANFMYYETDGSVEHGFECITQPATFGYHYTRKHGNYENAFRLLVSSNFRSHNTNSCGLHVHVNRNYFKNDKSYLFLLKVFDKYWNELSVFSRRQPSQLSRWASRYEGTPEQILNTHEDIFDRYKCINFGNYNTIEFRIFRGTLNPTSYFSCLKLVDNICVMANQFADDRIRMEDIKFEDFLTEEYMKDYWQHAQTLHSRHNTQGE